MHEKSWLAAILLVFLAAQCLIAAITNGQTTDESFFSSSGYPIVRYNNYEFLGEHPPLAQQIGALPLLFLQPKYPINDPWFVPGTDRLDLTQNGLRFLYTMGNNPRIILLLERIPIILLTVLLGIGIYIFGRKLFGEGGALVALALFSFDPNIIAHGSLYTTDMGLTVFYFFAIFAASRFFDHPSDRTVLWLGIACGAAFMSKVSSLILLPGITVLFLIYYFTEARRSEIQPPSRRFENWILGLSIFLIANAIGEKQAMVMFGPFLIPALYLCARDLDWVKVSRLRVWILHGLFAGGAVLCAYYAWRLKKKYGVSLGAILAGATAVYFLITVAFIRLASSDKKLILFKQFLYVWALTAAFIIFGYTDLTYKFYRFIGFGNYMKPIGNVISHSTDGHGSCIEGSFVTCDWRYFFGVTAIKTPLLTLMFGLWGAVALLFSKRSPLIKALLLLPLCFFFGAAMFNKIRIGLRHILPVYPFFFLLAGFAASMVGKIPSLPIRRVFIAAVTLLVILSSARTLSHAPDYLSYFNEWIGGPEQGAKIVGDSNIDWGQDNQRLAEFVKLNAIPAIKIRSTTMNEPIFKYNGINWSRFDANDLVDPAPGYYAVGIGQYAAFQKDPSSWFYKKAPDFRVGKTFYVYKVGNEAHA